MLPLLWKFGKRLMPHRFPCSTVILFVCIVLICIVSLTFGFLPEPPREVYLRISGASFKGDKDKASKMILCMTGKSRRNKAGPFPCSRMPNFAPVNHDTVALGTRTVQCRGAILYKWHE